MKYLHPIYYVPKNWLSSAVGWAVRRSWPFGLHVLIRDTFIRFYKVNTQESEYPVDNYPTLGAFFIRRLKPGMRPLAEGAIVSPVDGKVTQGGPLGARDREDSPLLFQQVKGKSYTFEILAPGISAEPYRGGGYNTIYLAPYNYHRVHSPISAKVTKVIHIPGALWPVNSWSVQHIDGLFSVNERIVVELSTSQGSMLVILVGATNVGKMTLDFCADIVGNAQKSGDITEWVPPSDVFLEKGAPLGCFEMGSTVILVSSASLTQSFRDEVQKQGNPIKNHSRTIQVGQPISFDTVTV